MYYDEIQNVSLHQRIVGTKSDNKRNNTPDLLPGGVGPKVAVVVMHALVVAHL